MSRPAMPIAGSEPGEDEASYSRRLAQELEAKILELGPDKVAAFVAETVVGATLGAVPPTAGYFQRIRAVCDDYGVLLILDEVMSGMGRTGHLFACTEDEVVPDIVVIAKGLGAGYQPIGAMMAHRRIYDAILAGSGFFQHGHTYLGHAIACAAALEVQKVIAEEDLLPKVRRLGETPAGSVAAAPGSASSCRGYPRSRPLPRHRARRRPREQRTARYRLAHPCEVEGRGHAPRSDDLSHGRDHRRGARRPCAARPALHLHRGARSTRSPGSSRKRSMPSSPPIDRIVVAVAPNGARKTRRDHPALPITPQELADCAAACRDAGASMLHLHVRNAEGGHSLAASDYRPAIEAVRRAVGRSLVLQLTSEAVGIYASAEQQAMVRELRPEAVCSRCARSCPMRLPSRRVPPSLPGLIAKRSWSSSFSMAPMMWNAMPRCAGVAVIPDGRQWVLFVLGRYAPAQRCSLADLLPFLAAWREGAEVTAGILWRLAPSARGRSSATWAPPPSAVMCGSDSRTISSYPTAGPHETTPSLSAPSPSSLGGSAIHWPMRTSSAASSPRENLVLTLSIWISLSLSQIKSERIGDAVRRDEALRRSGRHLELRAKSARPCPATDACGPHCSMSCTIAAGAEGAVRQAQRHGRAPPA